MAGHDYMLDDLLEVAYTGSATFQGVADMGGTASYTIAGGTIIPRPLVEIAFSTNPTDASPVWSDVTEYVVRLNIRRGRQRELDVIEPGTCTMTLDNDDRRFDPSYTLGPYYGNILPVRRIRIRAIWNNVIYNVFSGYAGGWPQEYPTKHRNLVSLDAIDALGFLSFAEVSVSRPQELTGARVSAVLNAVNWPAADRAIDVGQETLSADAEPQTGTALSMLQEISATEMGRVFADKSGKITFHGRDRIITSPPASEGTWSDALFDPLSVLNLLAWWDFSDISTLWQNTSRTTPITSSGQMIKGVTDKSGNGRHLSEATNGPLYITGGQNGLSVSRYTSAGTTALTVSGAVAQPVTVFVTGKFGVVGGTNFERFVDNAPGGSGDRIVIGRMNAVSHTQFHAGVTSDQTGIADNTWGQWNMVANGASSAARMNGIAKFSGNLGTQDFDNGIVLGRGTVGSEHLNGDIGEVFLYSGVVGASDILALESYVASRWAL